MRMSICYSLRLSQSGICGRKRPQIWTKGGSQSRHPLPSPQSPFPFSLPPYPLSPTPYPFQRLLRRLHNPGLLARFSDIILRGNQCWRHKWWLFYSGYSRTCCIMKMINSIVLYSDNVSNSYGTSWVSSCEKSRLPLQNHWVPVQGTMRPWVFMYPQLIWRQTQKLCVTCSLLKLKFIPSMIKHNKD